MSNEFKTIMTDMENSFTILHTCKSLGELKEKYVIFEFHREKLIEWINSNFSENEELYHTYIDRLVNLKTDCLKNMVEYQYLIMIFLQMIWMIYLKITFHTFRDTVV